MAELGSNWIRLIDKNLKNERKQKEKQKQHKIIKKYIYAERLKKKNKSI